MRSTLIEPVSLRIQRHARRRLLWLVATIAAFGCGVTTEDSTGIKPAARPPNILLIIADDVGVDQIGVYGEGTNRDDPEHRCYRATWRVVSQHVV
jgi:hypothetical protein